LLKELGTYKQKIISALSTSDDIKSLLLGGDYENQDYEVDDELKKYILPHLFTEGTQTEVQSYIFVETFMPKFGNSVKDIKTVVQVLSHRDQINYQKDGYIGTRPDICAEMIEAILIGDKAIARSFGIGSLTLTYVGILDKFTKYYGRELVFEVPDFR